METLGFTHSYNVSGRLSIADLFRKAKGKRRGIYMLHFADSLSYIGKAEDVVRRFGQHRKNYDNIVELWFQSHPKGDLFEIETKLIRSAPSLGYRLTNIVDGLDPLGETDLDILFSRTEQERWLVTPSVFAGETVRVVDEDHRVKYRRRFEKFQQHKHFDEIVRLLRHYVHDCVPVPRRTERTFWSLSCLPATNNNARLLCLNINTMEIMVMGPQYDSSDDFWAFLNVSKSTLMKKYKNKWSFYMRHIVGNLSSANYSAAGPDAVRILASSMGELEKMLSDPIVLEAARTLNLRVMRKGATVNWRSHCFDLADFVV